MKNEAIFLGHLGLGDHIIQQGIVNKLASQYRRVFIFCKHHNLGSVRYMCSPNVNIIPVAGDEDVHQLYPQIKNADIISVGFYNENWEKLSESEMSFDRYFYHQANLDFATTYNVDLKDGKQWETVIELDPKEPFCFIHDDASRGFGINMTKVNTVLPVVRPTITSDTIFDYLPLIRRASEIHCIDSSFVLMIDRANIKCDKKRVHRYIRNQNNSYSPFYTDEWEIIR